MKKKPDLSNYYIFGMPLLLFLALIALGGIVLTIILNYFF